MYATAPLLLLSSMDRLLSTFSQENLPRPLILLLFELFPSVSISQSLFSSSISKPAWPLWLYPYLTILSTPCLDTPRLNYSQPDGQGIKEELRRWMRGLKSVSMQPLAHRAGAACHSLSGSSLLQRGSVNCSPLPLEGVLDAFFSAKQESSCTCTVKQPLGVGGSPTGVPSSNMWEML